MLRHKTYLFCFFSVSWLVLFTTHTQAYVAIEGELPPPPAKKNQFKKKVEDPLKGALNRELISEPSQTVDKEEIKVVEDESDWSSKEVEYQPSLNLRVDAISEIGNHNQFGFFIDYFDISIFGQLDENIRYRASLGQTKNYSTVMLNQLVPAEAFIEWGSRAFEHTDEMHLDLKIGLMTPWFNPKWDPDLRASHLPQYFRVHQKNFLFREIGAEAMFRSPQGEFQVGVGGFNGNGNTTTNPSNAKVLTTGVRYSPKVGSHRLEIGASAFYLRESKIGSSSFVEKALGNAYFGFQTQLFQFWAEGFYAFSDELGHQSHPYGGLTNIKMTLLKNTQLWLHGEYSKERVNLVEGDFYLAQAGPIFQIRKGLDVFLLLNYYKEVNEPTETYLGQLRFRLNI